MTVLTAILCSLCIYIMHLQAVDCPDFVAWIEEKTKKYTSGDIQNECLQYCRKWIF